MVIELLRRIAYTELTNFNQGAAMVKNGVWEVNQECYGRYLLRRLMWLPSLEILSIGMLAVNFGVPWPVPYVAALITGLFVYRAIKMPVNSMARRLRDWFVVGRTWLLLFLLPQAILGPWMISVAEQAKIPLLVTLAHWWCVGWWLQLLFTALVIVEWSIKVKCTNRGDLLFYDGRFSQMVHMAGPHGLTGLIAVQGVITCCFAALTLVAAATGSAEVLPLLLGGQLWGFTCMIGLRSIAKLPQAVRLSQKERHLDAGLLPMDCPVRPWGESVALERSGHDLNAS